MKKLKFLIAVAIIFSLNYFLPLSKVNEASATSSSFQEYQVTFADSEKTNYDAVRDETSGTVHIVYESEGKIYYQNNKGVLNQEIADGTNPSIAIGPNNSPQIVFSSGSKIKYITKSLTSWLEPIEIGDGEVSDIAVDSNNKANVVYRGDINSDGLVDIVQASNVTGSFNSSVFASGNVVNHGAGSSTSDLYNDSLPVIKLDENNKYHILYSRHHIETAAGQTNNTYNLIYKTDSTSQATYYSENFNPVINKNSLSLDSNNQARIVYNHLGSNQIYYAVPENNKWNYTGADQYSGSEIGEGTNPALNLNGTKIGIAYNSGSEIEYIENRGSGFGEPTEVSDGNNSILLSRGNSFMIYYLKSDSIYYSADSYVQPFSNNYQASFISQSSYPTVNNGETKTMTISYRNTGSTVWEKGVVNLGMVDKDYNWSFGNYPLSYNWKSNNRPAYLNEDYVLPGEVGSFTFSIINNNLDAGNYRLDVGLVADGITWFDRSSHAYWNVNVMTKYSAEFVSQSNYVTVNEGETKTITISYRNTGSVEWNRGVVNLGTTDTNYNWKNDNYPLENNWKSNNRPAYLNESRVLPGEVGSFTFTIKNNGLPDGNYRLDVGLVADGIQWFSRNTHAYWDVTVEPKYDASFINQSDYLTIMTGDTKTMTISYRNTGSAIWHKGIVNLGTVDENYNWKMNDYELAHNWLSNNRPARLNQDTVAPGEVGTFTFQIYGADNLVTFHNYRIDVGLVADGIQWFPRATHAYWDVLGVPHLNDEL